MHSVLRGTVLYLDELEESVGQSIVQEGSNYFQTNHTNQ
jgi:hypothetical protein